MQRCIILLAALAATVAATGCAPTRARSLVKVEIRLAQTAQAPGLIRFKDPARSRPTYRGRRLRNLPKSLDAYLFMQPEPVLTQDDILEAEYLEIGHKTMKQQEDGKYAVEIETMPGVRFRISWSAARRLSAALKEHSKKVRVLGSEIEIAPYLVILVEERVVVVVPVKGKVRRKMLISGGLNREKAQELADALAGRAQPERRLPSDW